MTVDLEQIAAKAVMECGKQGVSATMIFHKDNSLNYTFAITANCPTLIRLLAAMSKEPEIYNIAMDAIERAFNNELLNAK